MCSTNCANTLFVSPIVQVKIAFSKTQDKTLLFVTPQVTLTCSQENKNHQVKIHYLLRNSSDVTEEVTLQSELACVLHAITSLRAVSSHSGCTYYHQQENMPLRYFGIEVFFLVPPYFCPLFHYFFHFFPPSLSLACFFLPALTLLHLNFFPMSKPHVFFQHFPFLLELGLTGHITVTLLPVTVCNCICWFRKSFPALYFFLVSCSFDKTWSFWWRFMFRY